MLTNKWAPLRSWSKNIAQITPLLSAWTLFATATMAADVTATTEQGTLVITESIGQHGASTDVEIFRDNNAIVVRGISAGRNTTTVNGQASARFSGVDTLVVELGDGADTLEIGERGALAPVFIVAVINMGVARSMDDEDELTIGRMVAQEHLMIDTGAGRDEVFVSADIGPFGFNSLLIDTGAGMDVLEIQDSQLGELTIITTHDGFEHERDIVDISFGVGEGTIFVDVGNGNDDLRMEEMSIAENLVFEGERGVDTAILVGVTMQKAIMYMGPDNDEVTILESTIQHSELHGDAGFNDSLEHENLRSRLALTGWEWINGRTTGIYAPRPKLDPPVFK